MSAKRIVIAAGGTAGHVVPALAVADALRADGVEVAFIGGERAEAELVPAAGFPLHGIRVEGLSRRNPLRAARALLRAVLAAIRARSLLRALRPDAVMGGGGYVSAPVALAALSLRVPLVLTEADSHIGLSNRMLAPFARRVCLAFPPARRRRARSPRYRVTGR
ncbi:MAG TPA: glycosyltransferase, partial [Solirubrobacteraceae bacterium]|nr:glycosyltransferase [Solirubrobacteraceae bacterium]